MRLSAALACVLSAGLGFSASAAALDAPVDYKPVLSRHALDLDGLEARGFVFIDGRCLSAQGEDLSPQQLDERLAAQPAQAAAALAAGLKRTAPVALPRMALDLQAAQADAVVVSPQAPEAPSPWKEPDFDLSWDKTAAQLRSKKDQRKGLKALSSRFTQADSDTGLSGDAPEALRLLTQAIKAGQGGDQAYKELNRQLRLVAGLKPEQKEAFASRLKSPWTSYAALGASHAPHSLDAQLYFKAMERHLDASGLTLSAFMAEQDPKGRLASSFLLRAQAYDALIPYLNRHPEEAAAIVAPLFSEGTVKSRALQLQGLLDQLTTFGRASGALDAFVGGVLDAARQAKPRLRDRMVLLLALNKDFLPPLQRGPVAEAAKDLPPEALQAPDLAPLEPYAYWPLQDWRFAVHFATEESYRAWRDYFLKRGYTPEPGTGLELSKEFTGTKIIMEAKLYASDKEGFLRGPEAKRFLAEVAKDLKDPDVQGVILRMHSQFRIAALFHGGASQGKLLLDGSCRSAWDAAKERQRCPTCSFILNTGTGFSRLNNPAMLEVLEGLARRRSWDEIGQNWRRAMPKASSRMRGPWTAPYEEAIAVLEKAERRRPSPLTGS